LFCVASFAAAACESTVYKIKEQFGIEKRDILVARVKDGRESQAEAKTEMVDALEAFRSVANFKGGDLEKLYDKLKDKYANCDDAVSEVKNRIAAIEQVSKDLFAEWKTEIDGMHDAGLKAKSTEMLRDTKARYATMIAAMKSAESKMEPVLVAFKDHVTFLKHNLNAKAVASLQDQLVSVEGNVASLVSEMEKSIAEADDFIESMDSEAAPAK
jgi:predicted  nucleic acid-binding Zn-ribbon protein